LRLPFSEDRVPRHQDIGAGSDELARILGSDAAVDFDERFNPRLERRSLSDAIRFRTAGMKV
jgi:hypothetical protein